MPLVPLLTAARANALACAAAAAGAVALACWICGGVGQRRRWRRRGRRRRRVVVLGGGFAGAELARLLQWQCEVLLIDESSQLEFTPEVLKVLAGGLPAAAVHRPLAAAVPGARVVVAAAAAVDLAGRTVSTTDGGRHRYECLILATGSGYAAPVKPAAAEPAAARRRGLAEAAAEAAAARSVVVVGGGVVGVELAADLASYGAPPPHALQHPAARALRASAPAARLSI